MWWLVGVLSMVIAWLLLRLWQLRQQTARMSIPPSPPPDLVTPLVESIGEALTDGLMLVHADRRIAFANDTLREILNLPVVPEAGQSLISVLRDYHADELVERALERGEPQTMTFQPTFSQQRLLLACQPLLGPLDGAVVVVRDLTQLAQLERSRRELVANVSHELRTPLASVRVLVETLASGPPPEIAKRMLGQIEDETQAMTQLVDELGQLTDIESGRLALQVQPLAVADIILRAVDRMKPQAERHGLQLNTDCVPQLPRVLVDADRIGQVLLNLLSNAVKFTPEGGTISVCASLAPTEPPAKSRMAHELVQVEGTQWVLLTVSDTGIGIPTAEVERVFERFYKVDRARTRNSGGTGLGLAIVKHLVERQGGRIWAESREGHGSTFSLLLPVA